jgi:hypothetical protein
MRLPMNVKLQQLFACLTGRFVVNAELKNYHLTISRLRRGM